MTSASSPAPLRWWRDAPSAGRTSLSRRKWRKHDGSCSRHQPNDARGPSSRAVASFRAATRPDGGGAVGRARALLPVEAPVLSPVSAPLLGELGLKRTTTDSFWGYDAGNTTLYHIHATTRVLIPDMMGNIYRLPIEAALLVAPRGAPFPVPPPAVELFVFVLRATLRHSWRDLQGDGLHGWLPIARAELAHLEARAQAAGADVHAVRKLELPYIDAELFDTCRAALEPGIPLARRL